MNPLTFQAELEQMIAEMIDAPVTIANSNKHLARVGRYLLIGQEFLSPDEYQTAVRASGLSEENAAFALERCKSVAIMHRQRKEIQEHANDLPWLQAMLGQAREEIENDLEPEEIERQEHNRLVNIIHDLTGQLDFKEYWQEDLFFFKNMITLEGSPGFPLSIAGLNDAIVWLKNSKRIS